ncbi:MAG: substrate-binding domain-containing protein, partial [Bacteroidota bacterium]
GNANYSTLIQPQISSIDQENVMMGELAATILLKKLKEEVKPTTKVLSPKLVQRASSKVVSI